MKTSGMDRPLTIFLLLIILAADSQEQAQSSKTQTTQTVTCPDVMCGPEVNIPDGCEQMSFFEMDGVRCEGCEVNGCDRNAVTPPCPKLACEGPHIPQRCQMPTYFRNRHFTCQGCPRDNCATSTNSSSTSSSSASASSSTHLQTNSNLVSMPSSFQTPWRMTGRPQMSIQRRHWFPNTHATRSLQFTMQPNRRFGSMWAPGLRSFSTFNHAFSYPRFRLTTPRFILPRINRRVIASQQFQRRFHWV